MGQAEETKEIKGVCAVCETAQIVELTGTAGYPDYALSVPGFTIAVPHSSGTTEDCLGSGQPVMQLVP